MMTTSQKESTAMDKNRWLDVVEYLIVAAAAAGIALVLADSFSTPLWGGLTSVQLH